MLLKNGFGETMCLGYKKVDDECMIVTLCHKRYDSRDTARVDSLQLETSRMV
jgi:hypothetical protein